MFGILDRYIGRAILATSLLVLLTLVALAAIFGFVSELEDVGTGRYTVWKAAQYVLLRGHGASAKHTEDAEDHMNIQWGRCVSVRCVCECVCVVGPVCSTCLCCALCMRCEGSACAEAVAALSPCNALVSWSVRRTRTHTHATTPWKGGEAAFDSRSVGLVARRC